MSRTFKSKDAQRLHRKYKTYNRYYGYNWDYHSNYTQEQFDKSFACFLGYPMYQLVTKRDIYKNEKYIFNEEPLRYLTGMNMDNKDRRYENRRHRMKVKKDIFLFMKGRIEDVVATGQGPRNPYWHWY